MPTVPRSARGAGLSQRVAWRSRHIERNVQADAAARRATFDTEADCVRVVEESEVVRVQPVVADNYVRIAVHVKLHEGSLLVEVAAPTQRLFSGAMTVRLQH